MGVAVLEEGQLLHSQVINLKRCRPLPVLLNATRRALDRLTQLFRVSSVVMEQVPSLQPLTFALLVRQAQAIRRWALSRGLPLTELAAQTVRKHLVQNGRATKAEAAKIVASRFPELAILLNQAQKNKDAYWQNLFDAVALAVTRYELRSA